MNKRKSRGDKPLPLQPVDFERVFRSSPDPYLLISPEFILLSASDAYLQATQRTYHDIVGKHIFEAFPGNPKEPGTGVANVRNAIETVLATGKMHTMPEQKYDVPIVGTNNFMVKYWSPTHHPILDVEGNVMYVLQRPIDITEQVLNTQKIKTLESEKEQLIAEQFSWIASHDLKEPLRKMSTFFEMLDQRLEESPDSALKKYEESIRDSTQKMLDLINDVQHFAQLWTVTPGSLPVDLNEIMASVKLTLAREIVGSDVTLRCSRLPVVLSHPLHMQTLLRNLLDNAVKFRQKGVKPVIEIGAKRQGSNWTIYVKDNGIGILHRYHNKIFQMLQRLHPKEYPGTGMGLTTCKKIVEMNSGKIWVESEPGKGSTFFFTLPAGTQAPKAIA